MRSRKQAATSRSRSAASFDVAPRAIVKVCLASFFILEAQRAQPSDLRYQTLSPPAAIAFLIRVTASSGLPARIRNSPRNNSDVGDDWRSAGNVDAFCIAAMVFSVDPRTLSRSSEI